MLRNILLTNVVVLVAWTAAASAEERTWSSAAGSKIEAEMVKLDGESLHLRRADNGKEIVVNLSQLIPEDRAYARRQAAAAGGTPAREGGEATPAAGGIGWKPLEKAGALGLQSIQPVIFDGAPYLGKNRLESFMTADERSRNTRHRQQLLTLLSNAAAPDVFGETRADIKQHGVKTTYDRRSRDFYFLQSAIQAFGIRQETQDYSAAVRGGMDEFKAEATLSRLLDKYENSLKTIQPQPVFEFYIGESIDVGSYDRETGSFQLDGRAAGVKPASLGDVLNGVYIDYNPNYQPPTSLVVPIDQAKQILSVLGGTQGVVMARARLTKLWAAPKQIDSSGRVTRKRWAAVELVDLSLYSNDPSKKLVYKWKVRPTTVAGSKIVSTTPAAEDPMPSVKPGEHSEPANRSRRLEEIKKVCDALGVPHLEGRPILPFGSPQAAKRYFNNQEQLDRLRKFQDLIELGLNPEFFEKNADRLALHHLSKAEAQKYINTDRFPKQLALNGLRWKGSDEFAARDSRDAFLTAYRDKFVAAGIKPPYEVVVVFDQRPQTYDEAKGGFPLKTFYQIDTVTGPPPLSIAGIESIGAYSVGFGNVFPDFLKMDRELARSFVKRVSNGNLFAAAVVQLDPVEGTISTRRNRVALVPKVISFDYFSDDLLRSKLLSLKLPQPKRSISEMGIDRWKEGELLNLNLPDSYGCLMESANLGAVSDYGWERMASYRWGIDQTYYQRQLSYDPSRIAWVKMTDDFDPIYAPFYWCGTKSAPVPATSPEILDSFSKWISNRTSSIPKQGRLEFRYELSRNSPEKPVKVRIYDGHYFENTANHSSTNEKQFAEMGFSSGQVAEANYFGLEKASTIYGPMNLGVNQTFASMFAFPNQVEKYALLSPELADRLLGTESSRYVTAQMDVEIGRPSFLPKELSTNRLGFVIPVNPTRLTIFDKERSERLTSVSFDIPAIDRKTVIDQAHADEEIVVAGVLTSDGHRELTPSLIPLLIAKFQPEYFSDHLDQFVVTRLQHEHWFRRDPSKNIYGVDPAMGEVFPAVTDMPDVTQRQQMASSLKTWTLNNAKALGSRFKFRFDDVRFESHHGVRTPAPAFIDGTVYNSPYTVGTMTNISSALSSLSTTLNVSKRSDLEKQSPDWYALEDRLERLTRLLSIAPSEIYFSHRRFQFVVPDVNGKRSLAGTQASMGGNAGGGIAGIPVAKPTTEPIFPVLRVDKEIWLPENASISTSNQKLLLEVTMDTTEVEVVDQPPQHPWVEAANQYGQNNSFRPEVEDSGQYAIIHVALKAAQLVNANTGETVLPLVLKEYRTGEERVASDRGASRQSNQDQQPTAAASLENQSSRSATNAVGISDAVAPRTGQSNAATSEQVASRISTRTSPTSTATNPNAAGSDGQGTQANLPRLAPRVDATLDSPRQKGGFLGLIIAGLGLFSVLAFVGIAFMWRTRKHPSPAAPSGGEDTPAD